MVSKAVKIIAAVASTVVFLIILITSISVAVTQKDDPKDNTGTQNSLDKFHFLHNGMFCSKNRLIK